MVGIDLGERLGKSRQTVAAFAVEENLLLSQAIAGPAIIFAEALLLASDQLLNRTGDGFGRVKHFRRALAKTFRHVLGVFRPRLQNDGRDRKR